MNGEQLLDRPSQEETGPPEPTPWMKDVQVGPVREHDYSSGDISAFPGDHYGAD